MTTSSKVQNSLLKEIWEPIQGYEFNYQISNLGNVKSLNYNLTGRSQNLILKSNNRGYLLVALSKKSIVKYFTIHRLVATHFIKNPNNLPEVNHIDENKKNNNVKNLEWSTSKNNANHGSKMNRISKKLSKKVIQMNLKGEKLKVWDSVTSTKEMGFNIGHVASCARGDKKTHKGFKWQYY